MADLDKTFRTPDGETWVRVAGHYFIVKDKEGMVNLTAAPQSPPGHAGGQA
jgi:Ni/Co efflux regulator RcnB